MRARDWINLGILTLIAIGMGASFPELRGAVIALWTLVVLGYGLVLLGDRFGGLVLKSRFERALIRRPMELNRPEDLQRCEHSLGWKSYSIRDFDHEVRPQLAALVAHRSKRREGIDHELASLVHPAGREQSDELSIKTPDLVRLVKKIEQL